MSTINIERLIATNEDVLAHLHCGNLMRAGAEAHCKDAALQNQQVEDMIRASFVAGALFAIRTVMMGDDAVQEVARKGLLTEIRAIADESMLDTLRAG